jgi:hypothetical protein
VQSAEEGRNDKKYPIVKEDEPLSYKEERAGPIRILIGITGDGPGWYIGPDGHLHHWTNRTPLVKTFNEFLERIIGGLVAYQTVNRTQGLRDMKTGVEDLSRTLNAMKE